MTVLRITATVLDILCFLLIFYFMNRKDYQNGKLSNFVFSAMMLAFGLSAVMMWR